MAPLAPPEGATLQQTIIESFATVKKETEDTRKALKLLEERVVTKENLEDIITNRVMTKQDFQAQRAKDDVIFAAVMKERVTRRMLVTTVSGFGCALTLFSGTMTLIIGVAVFLLLRFLPG